MNSKVHKLAAPAAAVAVLFALASAPAQAVVVYSLNQTAAALGPGPYGTVTLTELSNEVDVSVTLTAGLEFVTTGSPNSHALFALNLGGIAGYTFGGFDPAVLSHYAPAADSPFGSFTDGIACLSCANGAPGAVPPPISFKVFGTGLTAANFVGNDGGFVFAADLINPQTGVTGAVAAGGPVPGIPEPGTYALMLAGLGVVGFMARRRRPQ